MEAISGIVKSIPDITESEMQVGEDEWIRYLVLVTNG